jgi:hypothetical protein
MLQQLTKLKMKKTRLLAPMLMIFLLCLIFTSTLLVQGIALVADDGDDDTDETEESEEEETDDKEDEDDDGIDDDLEEANEREVKIEATETEVTIESELKSEDGKNEFKIAALTDDGIELKLEYKNETEAEEAELEFKVNFYELIEYVDENADGVYNASADTLVKSVLLNDFKPIDYSTGTNAEGTTVHTITISTTDDVFICQIYAVGEFATIDGVLVTPTEIKIDLEIHNFNYDNTDSDLALNIRVESTGEHKMVEETEGEKEGYATDESGFEVTMGDFSGYFSWTENVLIDGVEADVLTSPFEDAEDDDTEKKFYLNYPHGDISIIHDPSLGIGGILLEAPTESDSSTPSGIVSKLFPFLELPKEGYLAAMAIFTLVVLSVSVLFRRRRG